MSDPITITNDEEYHKYLQEVEGLMDLAPHLGSPESDRLIAVSIAVEEWEDRTFVVK